MMKKGAYLSPKIINVVEVMTESDILDGSVVTSETKVESTGQKVETYDFSGSSFNQTWGE